MGLFPSDIRTFDRCVRCDAVVQCPPDIQDGDQYWCRECWNLEEAIRVSADILSPYFEEIEAQAEAMLDVNHDEHYPWG